MVTQVKMVTAAILDFEKTDAVPLCNASIGTKLNGNTVNQKWNTFLITKSRRRNSVWRLPPRWISKSSSNFSGTAFDQSSDKLVRMLRICCTICSWQKNRTNAERYFRSCCFHLEWHWNLEAIVHQSLPTCATLKSQRQKNRWKLLCY